MVVISAVSYYNSLLYWSQESHKKIKECRKIKAFCPELHKEFLLFSGGEYKRPEKKNAEKCRIYAGLRAFCFVCLLLPSSRILGPIGHKKVTNPL